MSTTILRVLVAVATLLVTGIAFGEPPKLTRPRQTPGQVFNQLFRRNKLPFALPGPSTPPTADSPGVLRIVPQKVYGSAAKAASSFGDGPRIDATLSTRAGHRVLTYGNSGTPLGRMLQLSRGTQIYNYAIAMDGQIYLGTPSDGSMSTPHPTLVGGEAQAIELRGAGQVVVRDGKVVGTLIDKNSGHTTPSDAFIRQIVDYWRRVPADNFEGGVLPEYLVVDASLDPHVRNATPLVPPPLPGAAAPAAKAPPARPAPCQSSPAPAQPGDAVAAAPPVDAPAPARAPGAAVDVPPSPVAITEAPSVTPKTVAEPATVVAARGSGGGGGGVKGKFSMSPSTRANVTGQVKFGAIGVLTTVAGRVAAHKSGSETVGLATNVGLSAGTTIVVARVGGQSVVRSLGGATGATIVGMAAKSGTQYVTGSETAGDVAGFGGAAATGAAFGGPIGAGAGVIFYGASELAGSGVDYYYAQKMGASLEEKRKYGMVRSGYIMVLGREPTEPELEVWKRRFDRGMTQEQFHYEMSSHGELEPALRTMYQHHLGRDPSPEELTAAQDRLAHFEFISQIETDLVEAKRSYVYELNRLPTEAETRAFVGALSGPNVDRDRMVDTLHRGLANSLEAKDLVGQIYQAQAGRAPTEAEMTAASARLAQGASAFDLERELAATRTH